MQNDDIMLAVRSGTRVWCKRCTAVVAVRNSDKRFLKCGAGHKIYSVTVALSLSTDDDETPMRLMPPLHCWPPYAVDDMEAERHTANRAMLAVAE